MLQLTVRSENLSDAIRYMVDRNVVWRSMVQEDIEGLSHHLFTIDGDLPDAFLIDHPSIPGVVSVDRVRNSQAFVSSGSIEREHVEPMLTQWNELVNQIMYDDVSIDLLENMKSWVKDTRKEYGDSPFVNDQCMYVLMRFAQYATDPHNS